ncbi:hypothetical protein ACHAWX_003466 [Stephanocyclus meneghinianus]
MMIFKAMMSLALAMRIASLQTSVALGGMTRQRFQATVQTLVDDEMAFVLESPSTVTDDITQIDYSSSSLHRKTKSKVSKRSPSKLRGHDSGENVNASKLDALFDSIVSHGWDAVRSRSLEEDDNELFLICLNAPSSLGGADRMQQILLYFDINHTENVFFEPVRSSFEDLCVILSISARSALTRLNSTSDGLTIVPWVDVMKISPSILQQLLQDVPSHEHNDSLPYAVIVSTKSNATIDDVVRDVFDMAGYSQAHGSQKSGPQGLTHSKNHKLLEAFSLTRSTKNALSLNESHRYWSRMLETQDCSSMMDSMVVTPLSGDSLYQFQFQASTVTESCLVSFIVSLAVHSSVSRIGSMAEGVELHNLHARWVVQGSKKDLGGNDIFPWTAAGLNGSSQLVAISDTGLDLRNCYFVDSVIESDHDSIFENWNISRRKVLRYDSDAQGGDFADVFQGHGTHVSATIVGSHINGLGHGKEGIAPAARAHFFDICADNRCLSPHRHWFDSFTSGTSESPKVASASWGTAYLPTYDWTCYNYDKLVFEHPDLLLVASAGNNGDKGFSTIGAPASCKNVLAVGATFNALFGPTSFVASFSSRGPTSDGRIKPDILAPGYKLSSAIAGCHDCSIEEPESGLKAGTSMAAPVISGSALLIRQYFEEGYYPCGARRCGIDIFPSGSLVKAVLLNGAQVQLGVMQAGSGTIKMDQTLSDYDNTQGFGAANLLMSLPIAHHNDFGVYVRNDESLSFGESHSVELEIDQRCNLDFSVTLAWYDPPSSVGCTSCLVNDLDLLVEDMLSSKRFYPNGHSKPDRLNNVERIRIKNTSPGRRFRISVSATLLGPKHKIQYYSLVATGCFASPDQEPEKAVPSTPVVSQHQITTYRLINYQEVAGIMFSVKAKSKGVSVHSFAIPLEENANVYVYKLGKHGIFSQADASNSSAWMMISRPPPGGFSLNVTSTFNTTVVPKISFEVLIPKGSIQSFYITYDGERKLVCSRRRSIEGDENIEVQAGIGKNKLFDGRTIRPCFFEGAVMYSPWVGK